MRQHMDDIKKKAAERARKMGLTYAGALLPSEAHALMKAGAKRSEEHTSELQSQSNLVCRLLLEKKNAVDIKHGTLLPDPHGPLESVSIYIHNGQITTIIGTALTPRDAQDIDATGTFVIPGLIYS